MQVGRLPTQNTPVNRHVSLPARGLAPKSSRLATYYFGATGGFLVMVTVVTGPVTVAVVVGPGAAATGGSGGAVTVLVAVCVAVPVTVFAIVTGAARTVTVRRGGGAAVVVKVPYVVLVCTDVCADSTIVDVVVAVCVRTWAGPAG